MTTTATTLRWVRPMRPRDPDEDHRAATPLELFFDLCFVVAVAQAADRLHHGLAEGHAGAALTGYLMVFFAIWWAWMNFTWFASAYDIDDVPYRLAVMVLIAGVLILAAGIPRAFESRDFGVATAGYVVMRSALIGLWVRACRGHPECRRTALRYAAGIGACQAGWILLLAVPEGWQAAGWIPLVAAELAVPVWAERAGVTPWHPRHIAERYGLFTIIVLGECVLAASTAVQSAIDAGDAGRVAPVAGGGLLVVFAMWWAYFDMPAEQVLARARAAFAGSPRAAFAWGYGHYVLFAAVAAVGAGLQVAVDHTADHTRLSDWQSGATLTVPVAVYLLSVWALHARHKRPGPMRTLAVPLTAVAVLAGTGLGQPALTTGAACAALLTAAVITEACRPGAARGTADDGRPARR